MSKVTYLNHARLDAIELAISRLAIAITEAEGPHTKELESSIKHFRELFERPDISEIDRETYLRTIRLLDPLGNDPIEPF
ncbi:hypothetical protein RKT74_13460 [Leclercia pneumoniae]|uniref:hypothetical protein n=1 Tax=Leclercia pneumoniae TaxID=2815358 RepID=UPI0021E61DE5|nr:hypothetical protein [Leclercia pneumoniae]MCV2510183.1 hypothetical protein [Leclercia pneumoniae]WNN79738.1 hypothetical protein RKT74_13460 [Leclercia pneumoniae]